MKIFIQTFGCQMNVADSNEMSRNMLLRGMVPADDKDDADIVLLNTCTVRQHAEDKALSYIGRMQQWKKKDPKRLLIVTGCAAERLKATIKKRFPHIDLVIGAKSLEQFPELVNNILRNMPLKTAPAAKIAGESLLRGFDWFNESEESFHPQIQKPAGKIAGENGLKTGFVTVMRGCNYSCSYCIVPFVRGREVYRPPQDIINEVRRHVAEGRTEIMLLGQTVNSYWVKDKMKNGSSRLVDFSILLKYVNSIEGVERIRFMSPHPHYMTEAIVDSLAACEKVSPEIHLPVQSGSDKILRAMRRNYSREEYLKICKTLRKKIPSLKLGTDFVVGYPGETKEDFKDTLSLLDEVKFTNAYCFKYSARRGTNAAEFPDDVLPEVKEERLYRLLEKTGRKDKDA